MMEDKCPVCGGDKDNGTTVFTVDFKDCVLVVRNVPITVCSQCGEEWIRDDVASKLEKISNLARGKGSQFEVVDYRLAAAA